MRNAVKSAQLRSWWPDFKVIESAINILLRSLNFSSVRLPAIP